MQLLKNLQDQFNLAYLFIGHDLTKVAHLSDRIAVMYLGKIVETGPSQKIYQTPLHPYTQALISAIPIPDPIKERNRLPVLLKGHLPSPFKKPQGCVFHQRCPHAQEVCEKITPSRTEVEPGHFVECHFFKAHASVEQAGD
jgi:oligopeptide/dipeptide ABC transporter ATP-binding protein